MINRKTLSFCIMAASIISACGGGGNNPPKITPTSTAPPVTSATPPASVSQTSFIPSSRIGLVFIQDGKQANITTDNEGIQTLHIKDRPLNIYVPKSRSYGSLYISKVLDKVYHDGDPITIGGNLFARDQTMPAGGWPLYGTSFGSLYGYDFNKFSITDLITDGDYRVLQTEGITTLYPTRTNLLVYIDQTTVPVPEINHVEFFKIAYE